MHTPFHYFILNGHTVCDLQNVLKEIVLGWGTVFPDVLCIQAGDATGWFRGSRMQGEKQVSEPCTGFGTRRLDDGLECTRMEGDEWITADGWIILEKDKY